MKLAVTRCDGDTEIIILNDPVKVYEGSHQASIHSAEGMDHYFRISDGKYDGYGCGAPDGGWTETQAKTMIEAMQKDRQIIPISITAILKQRAKSAAWFLRWHLGHLLKQPGF